MRTLVRGKVVAYCLHGNQGSSFPAHGSSEGGCLIVQEAVKGVYRLFFVFKDKDIPECGTVKRGGRLSKPQAGAAINLPDKHHRLPGQNRFKDNHGIAAGFQQELVSLSLKMRRKAFPANPLRFGGSFLHRGERCRLIAVEQGLEHHKKVFRLVRRHENIRNAGLHNFRAQRLVATGGGYEHYRRPFPGKGVTKRDIGTEVHVFFSHFVHNTIGSAGLGNPGQRRNVRSLLDNPARLRLLHKRDKRVHDLFSCDTGNSDRGSGYMVHKPGFLNCFFTLVPGYSLP
ncbi:MAG: hypothetical protein BWY09_01737 [Candidatus Hydrogenedentes bacterium ADurb.Bin179]|nr:MAG: hypothetical protein BWY09_01737 [Candidatus Hydrogenedentes bacterium ADurb.Bin179]